MKALQSLNRRRQENKLTRYHPYAKQRDFHALGNQYRERGFFAANQSGKTEASGHEVAYHLTGLYPEWWTGKRWNRGVTGWALGKSLESTRDTLQRIIMGRPGEWGTGTVPKHTYVEVKKNSRGVADTVDSLTVKHRSGELSRLYFKSYEKGWEKLAGETLDFVAMDEEPPMKVYIEALTRTNATGGIVWTTFTPLLGMSDVVAQYLPIATSNDRIAVNMTIHEVDHFTAEQRQKIIDSYPAWERDARTLGIPTMGSGRVFPVDEKLLLVPPFVIPNHFLRIAGIDFGWDHPTAISWLAIDPDEDVIYVTDTLKRRNATPEDLAPDIKARGEWIPIAYPHDGNAAEKGSGVQLAQLYRNAGCNLLHEIAQFPETGDEGGGYARQSRVSVEAGVLSMLSLMQSGKLKVFHHLNDWVSEFRLYHRDNGKIVARGDDLLCATRYAFMMTRYATCPRFRAKMRGKRKANDWRCG